MRYLEAITFAIVFGIGNIVNLIWKKHMNKVFWMIDEDLINRQLDIE